MHGRSQGGTRRNSASSEERKGWGQVLQLSGVGSAGYASPPPEHLSRSNSEGWELLHHGECVLFHFSLVPCNRIMRHKAYMDSNSKGSMCPQVHRVASFPADQRDPSPLNRCHADVCRPAAQGPTADDGVEVRIVPGDDSVNLRITPTGSPMLSPRLPESDAISGNGAASPEAAASPLSGSAHSFEHLSQVRMPSSCIMLAQVHQAGTECVVQAAHCSNMVSRRTERVSCKQTSSPRLCMQDLQQMGSPTYARVQGGLVPSPPSLPDLEALNPSEVQPAKRPERHPAVLIISMDHVCQLLHLAHGTGKSLLTDIC